MCREPGGEAEIKGKLEGQQSEGESEGRMVYKWFLALTSSVCRRSANLEFDRGDVGVAGGLQASSSQEGLLFPMYCRCR
jgi:hypothetical protein